MHVDYCDQDSHEAEQVGQCGPTEPLTEDAVYSIADMMAQMSCELVPESAERNPDIISEGCTGDLAPCAILCPERGCLLGVA